jgi:hypothetical protein
MKARTQTKKIISQTTEDKRANLICPLKEKIMLGTILLVLLILMLLGALPTWPHSKNWGYYPSGGLGLIAVILVVLLLLGRI